MCVLWVMKTCHRVCCYTTCLFPSVCATLAKIHRAFTTRLNLKLKYIIITRKAHRNIYDRGWIKSGTVGLHALNTDLHLCTLGIWVKREDVSGYTCINVFYSATHRGIDNML